MSLKNLYAWNGGKQKKVGTGCEFKRSTGCEGPCGMKRPSGCEMIAKSAGCEMITKLTGCSVSASLR